MSDRQFTASRGELMRHCAHWLKHPEVHEKREDGDTGHDIHAAIAAIIDPAFPVVESSPENQSRVLRWAEAWHGGLGIPNAEAEVKFSYDPVTHSARRLPRGKARDYSAAPTGWINGTADAIGIDSHYGYVIDHKTGARSAGVVARHFQTRFYAMCWSLISGRDEIRVAIDHISEDGAVYSNEDTLGPEDHALTRKEVLFLASRDREPHPGPHCTELFCPAITTCAAVRNQVRSIVPIEVSLAIDTPERLQQALDVAPKARKLLKLLDQACHEFCDRSDGRVSLPDGGQYTRQSYERQGYSVKPAIVTRYNRSNKGS